MAELMNLNAILLIMSCALILVKAYTTGKLRQIDGLGAILNRNRDGPFIIGEFGDKKHMKEEKK